jgi:hypothetical protein
MDTVTVIAGLTWYVRMDIAEAADSNDGETYGYTPIGYGPFRTITHAIDVASDGDRIIVGPSSDVEPYGGPGAPENINVDKWLTIWSRDGRADTWIDVGGQDTPAQVVMISALWGAPYTWGPMGGVVFGCDGHGFTLKGSDTGIYAYESDYVYIHQNRVIASDECFAVGISVETCKAPVIDDNLVEVGCDTNPRCLEHGVGIDLLDCMESPYGDGAQVTNNTVSVYASHRAEGINVDHCGKALVHANFVTADAWGDCLAWGIKLSGESHLSQITWNDVDVDVHGNTLGAGFGIKVLDSDLVTVANNSPVNVYVSVRSGCLGGNLAVGILLCDSYKSDVVDNLVQVQGEGVADDVVDGVNSGGIAALAEDGVDLTDLQEAMVDVTGKGIDLSLAAGLVVGIIGIDAGYVDVMRNNVTADADLIVGAEAVDCLAIGGGAVLSLGITALCSMAPQITTNIVLADADADIHARATDVIVPGFAVGLGAGLAAGLGILVAGCMPDPVHGVSATVSGNQVNACGEVEALVEAMQRMEVDADAAGESVLERLDSDVISVVYDVVTNSVDNEEVDVQLRANPSGSVAIAAGGALGLGIGITALMSFGAQITGNNPVVGEGKVDVKIYAWDEVPAQEVAASLGGGLGLGIGILDAWSAPTNVAGNNARGNGDAVVDAAAVEVPVVFASDVAIAAACGDGIGLGIVVVGGFSLFEAEALDAQLEAEDEIDGERRYQVPDTQAWVVQNTVEGAGNSGLVTQAINRVPHTYAMALGNALAVGKGIVVVGMLAPVIAGNTCVTATANADATVYAAAISTVDPMAVGDSDAIAVGIVVASSPGAQITDNHVTAYACANGMTTAVEQMVMGDVIAVADGVSTGVGIGIMVANSSYSMVSRNYSEGDGTANVKAIAEQYEPLDEAWAWAVGLGIGKGIAVTCLHKAWVQESNTFIGNGHACVYAQAMGDLAHAAALGLALGVDECAVGVGYVAFNYNDMPMLGGSTGTGPVLVIDLGMLALMAGHIDARYQWWASLSGPTTEPVSDPFDLPAPFEYNDPFGQPLVSCAVGYPQHVPWLWGVHEPQLEDHIGKYGKYICVDPSWNGLSIPIALASHADEWSEILALSGITGGISAPMRYDNASGLYEVATQLVPLEGYTTIVDQPMCLILLASTESSMPTLDLAEGWNLIGPNPRYCCCGIDVGDAMTSVAYADGGAGFSHVISNLPTQRNWSYTLMQWRDNDEGPMMRIGKAYWVWMNSAETLAGFGFTPIGLYPDPCKGRNMGPPR